jgi:hypothetical protein
VPSLGVSVVSQPRWRVYVAPSVLLLAIALPSAATGARAANARPTAAAAVHRVLFDNSKAETAGNADWIISTSAPDPLAQNPAPTSESSWTGAISAWGVALQRTGQYSLKTLPPGNTISYGNAANALDLANFDEFVMPEPNIQLSAAEKSAIMRFVQAGGGFFLVVDHTGSDRNNDGWDSPKIANDLLTNNGVDNTDPFGFSVDLANVANNNAVAIQDSANPVLHGSFGAVTGSIVRNGTTATLHPADNAAVRGLVYLSTATPSGNTGAFFVTSTFGAGRVALWGDSSAIDDGTGQPGNTLFNGWNDPAGTDAALALNATAWLAGASTGGGGGGGGGCPAAQLLGNPGFETGTASPWSASASVVSNAAGEPAHGGSWDAWLDGYGSAHTDTLAQSISIPATCQAATLTFWLHVDTAETTTTSAFDKLTAQVVNSAGTVLATLATVSNLDAASGYQQRSFPLIAYAGQTVSIRFTGTEGSQIQTSFVIDDAAVNVS